MALRLAGDSATAPGLIACQGKGRLELGGLEATNSYVRFYLAMVGAWIGASFRRFRRN